MVEKDRMIEEAKAQKAQERREAIENAVILYAPGEEPANIRKRMDTLFQKLDATYPNRKISRLYQEHKKWGETVTELRRLIGYADNTAFLEAYGYTVELENGGGRPKSTDPVAIIAELHKRYPDGVETFEVLKQENPDIPWKTLANNSKQYFGQTLTKYLIDEGILKNEAKRGGGAAIDPAAIIAQLHQCYPDGAESVEALKHDNPDMPIGNLQKNAQTYFGQPLVKFLKAEGIIKNKAVASNDQNPETKKSNNKQNRAKQKPVEVLRFWLTDGVFHRENTEVRSTYAEDYNWYPDTGIAFEIPEDAESVVIPEGTRVVGRRAFHKFENLRKVTFPDSVEMIATEAFYYCRKLEEAPLPRSLKKLAFYAFVSTGLKSVVLPESLEEVESGCFNYCKQLEEIIFPDKPIKMSVDEEMADIFDGCKVLKRVVLPSDCKYSLNYSGCEAIEEVTIPNGIKSIFNGYFSDCKSLRSVTIPESVTKIDDNVFRHCESLGSVTIPESVTSIGRNAFSGCVSLSEIVLHKNIKSIGDEAFSDCTGLEHIVAKMPLKGKESAFKDMPAVKRVDVTQSSVAIAKTLFPNAEIYDLRGKLVHSPGHEDAQPGVKTVAVKKPTKTAAVKYHPGTKIVMLSKAEYDVTSDGHEFHVAFKGATTANKAIQENIDCADEHSYRKMYDPRELLAVNGHNLHTIDEHTGVRITTLSEAYEYLGETRTYSDPLNETKIMRRTASFVSDITECLREENVAKLFDLFPKKKNGTLHKGRVTIIRKCTCADSEGNVLALYAKNMNDTDVEMGVKEVFIGDDSFTAKEAAFEADII